MEDIYQIIIHFTDQNILLLKSAIELKFQGMCSPLKVALTITERNKILITGDSHTKGCAAELLTLLGKTFEVMGAVMPGSRLEYITHLARREISQRHCEDFVTNWGGANDININESDTGLRHIKKFALRNKHTNVITMTAPHRYDLQDFSCINKEIQIYNRKLGKMLKDMNHVRIIDMNLSRNEFAQRRLHMNSSSKEKTLVTGHKSFDKAESSHQFKMEGTSSNCFH